MDMPIDANCVVNPNEWKEILRLPNKDWSIGTGFERMLDHAGKALGQLANSEKEATLWIRGYVVLMTEDGHLKPFVQGPLYELKAKIEGVLEKCFRMTSAASGSYDWVACRPDTDFMPSKP